MTATDSTTNSLTTLTLIRKVGFGIVWLSFTFYAFVLAPPGQPDTLELIKNLSIGNWTNINPWVISLFNLMGIWPISYAAILYFDGRGQKIPAWPFAVGSFALGAFVLMPYLILRDPNPTFAGEPTRLLKVLDSRWLGGSLFLGAIVLLGYGVLQGNWADFVYQWQTRRFIQVMSLDFCLLSLLFPTLLGDDMARRGVQNASLFWIVSCIPLLGPAAYLIVRPPLTHGPQ